MVTSPRPLDVEHRMTPTNLSAMCGLWETENKPKTALSTASVMFVLK